MNAAPLPDVLADVLARGDIWRGDSMAGWDEDAVPSGHPELDAELPGGGWPRGCLTEILTDSSGLGELTLLLPALTRLSADGGWLALVEPPFVPNAPAWMAAGLSLERLVVIRAGKQAAWCGEQLLACDGFAGVLLWLDHGVDARGLRRLQVAAKGRATFACLWRPSAQATQASPSPLRLALAATRDGLSVRILKRRGRPAGRPLDLSIPRPVRLSRALAGPALSPVAARSAAPAEVA